MLLRPRWLGLALVAVLVALACVQFGRWQLDRLDSRRAANALVRGNVAAPAVPAEALLRPGQRPAPDDEWRPVTATGRYDPAAQLLVRNRPLEGPGSYVLVPLLTPDGTALLVNRGWVPRGATASTPTEVPAPPAGEVRVVGRVRVGEQVADDGRLGRADVPEPSVGRLDPLRVAAALPYPAYGGYVELVEEQPAAGAAPRTLPVPRTGEGPHLAYALQWFLFAGFALGGFVLLVRRELRDARAVTGPARAPVPPALDRA